MRTGRKRLVQVLLSDEEHAYVSRMAAQIDAQPARQGRALLLAWAQQVERRPGVIFGGQCGSSSGCETRGADWWNHAAKLYFCIACAAQLNERVPGLCHQGAAPDRDVLVEEAAVELRDKIATSRSRGRPASDPAAKLAETMRQALVEFENEVGSVDVDGRFDLPPEWLRALRESAV